MILYDKVVVKVQVQVKPNLRTVAAAASFHHHHIFSSCHFFDLGPLKFRVKMQSFIFLLETVHILRLFS